MYESYNDALLYHCIGLIPRFARVNTIKTSKENVIQQLKENGFEQVGVTNIASFLSQVSSLFQQKLLAGVLYLII